VGHLDTDNHGGLRRPSEAAAAARTRLDKRFEPETTAWVSGA
jgi:hypothetical protein